MSKYPQLYILLFVIAALTLAWLIINNFYITYYSKEIAGIGYSCQNGVLTKTREGLASDIYKMFAGLDFSLTCSSYPNSIYSLSCDDNGKIILKCKTTIYSRYFSANK